MTVPTPIELPTGVASWDAIINKNFQMLNTEPFPLYTVTDFANLPSAVTYDGCIALVSESATVRYLVFSNGTTWDKIQVADYVDASTAVDLTTTISVLNDTITALKDGGLMNVS